MNEPILESLIAIQCFDYIFSKYNELGLKLPKMHNFLKKKRDITRPSPHAKSKNIIHMEIVI